MYLDIPLLSSILDKKDFDYFIKPSATILISNIIKQLDIKNISLPAFLCEELLLSIYNLNINIHFYKLDSEFSPLLSKEHLESDCLFICDYFGYPIKKSKFLNSYFEKTNKPIIVDRCHSLFAGVKAKKNNIFLNRKNIFMIYSLRKFLPTINGAILINKKYNKLKFYEDDIFICFKSKWQSYLKNFIKINLCNNFIGNFIFARIRLYKINKKLIDQINGFYIKKPNLINREKIELGYYFKLLDNRAKIHINKKKLNKLSKVREIEVDKITKELGYLTKNKNYQINFPEHPYGCKYGIAVKIKNQTTKEEIENELIKPLLKINKKVEIFLWPYNNIKSFKINNIILNSVLLITPKIDNV